MFFEKVLHACMLKGVTTRMLVNQIGLSPSSVSRWKDRNSKPRDLTIEKISSYFMVKPEYFKDDNIPKERIRDYLWETKRPEIYTSRDLFKLINKISYLDDEQLKKLSKFVDELAKEK